MKTYQTQQAVKDIARARRNGSYVGFGIGLLIGLMLGIAIAT